MNHRTTKVLVLALLQTATASCTASTLDIQMPSLPKSWTSQSAPAPQAAPDQLKEWWKQFNDPSLNALVEQGLKANPDLRQAAAKIDEARGQQRSSFAQLLPLITGNAGASRSKELFFQPITGNNSNASFDASYELDIFGKNRAANTANELATQAASKDYDWVKLSMIAEIAHNYISMRAAEKQIMLAEKNLQSEKETLKLVQRQRNAGGSSDFDVERTALQLNQSAAHIADYKRQKEIYELSLITLTGLSADEVRALIKPANNIPGIGLDAVADTPASVLAHRPDIAAANLRLAQSTSLKESQAAAIFPTVNLSSMLGISKTILVDSTSVWNIGANASVNLLDFGRIQGQIDASSAREVQAYESWRKSILQAMQDVSSALTNVARIQEQRTALDKVKTNAAKALSLAQVRYKQGDASLLDVLDAQRQLIEADSSLIDAENNYVTSIIALYKALGQY